MLNCPKSDNNKWRVGHFKHDLHPFLNYLSIFFTLKWSHATGNSKEIWFWFSSGHKNAYHLNQTINLKKERGKEGGSNGNSRGNEKEKLKEFIYLYGTNMSIEEILSHPVPLIQLCAHICGAKTCSNPIPFVRTLHSSPKPSRIVIKMIL